MTIKDHLQDEYGLDVDRLGFEPLELVRLYATDTDSERGQAFVNGIQTVVALRHVDLGSPKSIRGAVNYLLHERYQT